MQPWRASLWLLPGVWALACGGRYQQTVEGDDAPSAGTASGSSPGCACDPLACVPFFRAVPDVGGCCDHCELDLTRCAQASNDYGQLRQRLIDKYNSQGCRTDADCSVYYNPDQCGVASCGLPLRSSAFDAVEQNLNSYAESSCSPACPAPGDLPCPPPIPLARCVMGRCI